MSNILEVENLRVEYRLRNSNVVAINDVSFSVREGECVGIVGESGCGKSTTGLSIMGLLPNVGHVTSGAIHLNGRDLVPLAEREMQLVRGNEVSMIFQDPMTSLNPTMTIGRQIAQGVRIHRGASKKEAMDRALKVLTTVGMPRPAERLNYYPHQLSGGLRQRVIIAMALACDPKLLIADEPTTALDVTIQAQILNLLDELREKLNMAIILITHDMGVIAGRTDRVLVMYGGKIVEGAETEELYHRVRHPYSSALLQSIPRLDQDSAQRLYNIPGIPPNLSKQITNCSFSPRCQNATERCRTEVPQLAPDPSSESHLFSCFNPVDADGSHDHFLQRETSDTEKIEVRNRNENRLAEIMQRDAILVVNQLTKEFPVSGRKLFNREMESIKAVSDVSFTVHKGETFGIVGESGCGKSTIGRLIVGLEKPNPGSIHFVGNDLTVMSGAGMRHMRRDLQLMFQDPYASLDPRMRVGRILREPLIAQGIGDRVEQNERIAQILTEVGLSPQSVSLYPHEFSGGQRQRIGFARALILQPKLIIADEPVSALDVSIQAQLLNMMKEMQELHGLSYIVISHDLAVVKYLADRIGVMYLGKLVEVGPAQAIYEKAAHPYTSGLINTIPVADPRVARAKRGHLVKGELPSAINPPSGCRFRTRCPSAQDVCSEIEPELRVFGDDHLAACHFPLQIPVITSMAATVGA